MPKRIKLSCTFEKACHVKWFILIAGLSQSQTAVLSGLNVGTVCHVIHGRRHPFAFPLKPAGF